MNKPCPYCRKHDCRCDLICAQGQRYCTCHGDDVPPPDQIGMCPDCFRLVESKAVA